MRGVFFIISNPSNFLYQILKCLDIEKYVWYNIEEQSEVLTNTQDPHENDLFNSCYYDSKKFLECIKSEHFVIFLKMQAYFEGGKFYNIHSYDEFIKSDCRMVLLVHDCNYVEFYSKDCDDIKAVYNNALNNNYSDVNIITDDNDMRTKFDVL